MTAERKERGKRGKEGSISSPGLVLANRCHCTLKLPLPNTSILCAGHLAPGAVQTQTHVLAVCVFGVRTSSRSQS